MVTTLDADIFNTLLSYDGQLLNTDLQPVERGICGLCYRVFHRKSLDKEQVALSLCNFCVEGKEFLLSKDLDQFQTVMGNITHLIDKFAAKSKEKQYFDEIKESIADVFLVEEKEIENEGDNDLLQEIVRDWIQRDQNVEEYLQQEYQNNWENSSVGSEDKKVYGSCWFCGEERGTCFKWNIEVQVEEDSKGLVVVIGLETNITLVDATRIAERYLEYNLQATKKEIACFIVAVVYEKASRNFHPKYLLRPSQKQLLLEKQ